MRELPPYMIARVRENPKTGCLEWTRHIDRHGYGRVVYAKRDWLAHRLAWMLAHDEDPGERLVCHSCDNRRCVNPAHLWLGTVADNNLDKLLKGRLPPVVGERNPRAKITEADVRAIRTDKRPNVELMRIYGVSSASISQIRNGKSWRHVQ